MASMKKFEVNLYPAKRDGAFISTKIDLMGMLDKGSKYPFKAFEAASTEEVVDTVTRFAKDHGQGCQAMVRCLSKPKPKGFDAATKGMYFNLEG
jgi:hypothetical protein